MPYISKKFRDQFKPGSEIPALQPGDLNYQFSLLINTYIKAHGPSYYAFNDVIGALECCKLEVYRRLAAPYEDKKIEENGDVF